MKEYWKELTKAQKTKYIVSAVAGLLVFIFAVLNWKTTDVHLIFVTIQVPKTLMILLSVIGGFGLATLFDFLKFRKKDKEIASLKKQLGLQENKSAREEE